LTLRGASEHLLELGPITLCARFPVKVFAGDSPPLPSGELPELRELVFDFLAFVFGGDSRVNSHAK
jgi:hypothetical protein